MMLRNVLVVASLLAAAACGSSPTGPSTPTAPSTPPVQQQLFTLSGTVTSTTGTAISGASVRIADGPNAGRSATTNSSGSYTLTALTRSGFTITITATNYLATSLPVDLTADRTINAQLDPTPLFTKTGVGDAVFDMPTTVARVRIMASTPARCQNFVVRIGGRLVVNTILGTCSVADAVRHDGTYVTTGGVTEITLASGVQWSFTEVR